MNKMYSTVKFVDIYGDKDAFLSDYATVGLPKIISDASATTLYFLLYAKFGNSPIANYDVNQFKYKLFSIVWQFGPSWEKRLDIQAKLRALTENEIAIGTKAIYNHAFNPGEINAEIPSTTTNQPELQYVNDQNVTNYTKSKMDAYSQLWELIDNDVTSEFLNRFTNLFKKFVLPGALLYESEDDDNE